MRGHPTHKSTKLVRVTKDADERPSGRPVAVSFFLELRGERAGAARGERARERVLLAYCLISTSLLPYPTIHLSPPFSSLSFSLTRLDLTPTPRRTGLSPMHSIGFIRPLISPLPLWANVIISQCYSASDAIDLSIIAYLDIS